MGHSAQQMKHENAQKISPNSSPRLPPESSNFVAAIPPWGKSGVTNRFQLPIRKASCNRLEQKHSTRFSLAIESPEFLSVTQRGAQQRGA